MKKKNVQVIVGTNVQSIADTIKIELKNKYKFRIKNYTI